MGVGHLVRNVSELTDPRALPNLECWYDSRYPNGIGSAMPFDGDTLSTWTDLSGKGRHLSQASANNRPMWASTNLYGNLLNNGRGDTSNGWSTNSSVVNTASWDTSVYRTAGQSRKSVINSGVSNTSLLSLYAVGTTGGTVPVVAGKTYTFSAWFYVSNTGYTARVALGANDSNGTRIITSSGSSVSLPVNTWTQAYITYTMPANAVNVYTAAYVESTSGTPPTTDTAWVDDALMIQGSTVKAYEPPITLPNGAPVVQFDGVDDKIASATGAFNLAYPITSYTVFRRGTTADANIWSLAGLFCSCGGSNRPYIYSGSSNANGSITDPWLDGPAGYFGDTWRVVSGVFNPSGGAVYVDGVIGQTGQMGNTSLNPSAFTLLGNAPDNSIATVMIYSGQHDDYTRKKVERMLARWYGLTVAS